MNGMRILRNAAKIIPFFLDDVLVEAPVTEVCQPKSTEDKNDTWVCEEWILLLYYVTSCICYTIYYWVEVSLTSYHEVEVLVTWLVDTPVEDVRPPPTRNVTCITSVQATEARPP